jgi:hypothetical protein
MDNLENRSSAPWKARSRLKLPGNQELDSLKRPAEASWKSGARQPEAQKLGALGPDMELA